MSGYAQLFRSILHSTIWLEDNPTRLVWITMLAMADRNGVVEASLPGVAAAARVSLAEAKEAMDKLKAPDPYSRTKEFEGRRVEEQDGSYILLTWEIVRRRSSVEARKAAHAARMQRYRSKKRSEQSGSGCDSGAGDGDSSTGKQNSVTDVYAATSSVCVCFSDPDPDPDPELPDRSGSPAADSEVMGDLTASRSVRRPEAARERVSEPSGGCPAGPDESSSDGQPGPAETTSSFATDSVSADDPEAFDVSWLDHPHDLTPQQIAVTYLHDGTAARQVFGCGPEKHPVVTELTSHWNEVWQPKIPFRPRGGLTDSRLVKILLRLKEGYTVQQLKDAISGARNDEWIAKRKNLQTLKTIFKDGDAVEKYCQQLDGSTAQTEADFVDDPTGLRHFRAKQGAEGEEAKQLAFEISNPFHWWQRWTDNGSKNNLEEDY